jgi:drug/metabolite transporter (DMT)-like permease
VIGIALIVPGIMVASGLHSITREDRRIGKGPMFALLASFLWGIGYTLLDRSVELVGWQTTTLVQAFVMTLIIGCVLWRNCRRSGIHAQQVLTMARSPLTIGAGVLQMCASLVINVGLAYDTSSGAIVMATSSCYPAITTLLAIRHFRERTGIISLTGAGVAILGVALLSY